MRLPKALGWTPSPLKKEERFQNKLKLSMKLKLWVLQADWSQVLRLRILLKRPTPRDRVGMGPLMNTAFPEFCKRLKRLLKSFLVSSDCWRAVSFVPTWTITLVVDAGREESKAGSLFRRD